MNSFSENNLPGEVTEKRSKVFLGILGAIAGALVGAALWIALYQIGIIASIAGIAIIALACKVYRKLAGKIDIKGTIICIMISIVILVGTQFFCWGLDIYRELAVEYDITLLDAIFSVPSIAFTADFVVDFVKELLIGLLLIIVGGVPYFKRANHERKLNAI